MKNIKIREIEVYHGKKVINNDFYIEHYKKQNVLHVINGEDTVENIFNAVDEIISNKKQKIPYVLKWLIYTYKRLFRVFRNSRWNWKSKRDNKDSICKRNYRRWRKLDKNDACKKQLITSL